VFVTGTGTEVGKTVVAASIVAALSASGHRVAAFKPAVSGLEAADARWPADHVLLAASTGWQPPELVAPYVFGPPVSPHLAAELAGTRIDPVVLADAFAQAAAKAEAIVCEGVGGLLVPLALDPPLSVLDLIKQFGLPAVVVAPAGLGAISDTRLTVDRLRAENVDVPAVVISAWPEDPSPMQVSNLETIAALCELEVFTLPVTTQENLAEAGAGLPVERWSGLQGQA
jgi:dethiobiotin synthetase